MPRYHRRTAPKVRDGRTQKKNRTKHTPNYYNTRQSRLIIDRRRPGSGYRHRLMVRDIERFIQIIPYWDTFSTGLDAIVLAPGDPEMFGWHWDGIAAVCAWTVEDELRSTKNCYRDNQWLLERLGVSCEVDDLFNAVTWQFTASQIRAFQLLGTLLHELGHHVDRITTKGQRCACRGEPYAEEFAKNMTDLIWTRYLNTFGLE